MLRFLCLSVFVFASTQFPACAEGKSAATPKSEKWFDVASVVDNIIWEKKPIALTPSLALQIFTKKSPKVVANWRQKVNVPIENKPGASGVNEAIIQEMRKADDKAIPYAELRSFSPYNLQVMILKPAGSHRWHHFYECLASFQIPRSAAIDAIFDVRNLERPYRATIQGLGYGDSHEKVVQTLGEPDFTVSYQPFGYFQLAFFKQDTTIQFQDNRIKTISRGVPADWKKQAQEGSKVSVRF